MTVNDKPNDVTTAADSVGGMTGQTLADSLTTNGTTSQSQQAQSQQEQTSTSSSSTTTADKNDAQYAGHPDEALFLGRWVLVDTKMSTRFVHWTSGEIITTREVNEKTGIVEYHTKTTNKLRLFFCCCISNHSTNISIYTSNDTFTVSPEKTNILEGDVDYGKKVGDKFITVGKKGTNEVEYRGDKCYMKIVDARFSLVATLEFDRVETFS